MYVREMQVKRLMNSRNGIAMPLIGIVRLFSLVEVSTVEYWIRLSGRPRIRSID